MSSDIQNLYSLVREIPDFPEDGVQFKDLTPILACADALEVVVSELIAPFANMSITAVAGVEARGFIFGSLVARALRTGFIPIRKPGKLPAATYSENYSLEYGNNQLHVHCDAAGPKDRVLMIDDVLATGGTAAASINIIEQTGAQVVACGFVVNLRFLGGDQRLSGRPWHSVLHYE